MKVNPYEKTAIVLFLLGVMCNAHASGDGDLWASIVMFTCLEQDPANQKTTLGQQFTKAPEYSAMMEGTEQGNGFKCLAKKKIVPQKLCLTLLNQTDETSKIVKLDGLYEQYKDSLDRLNDGFKECQTR